MTKYDASGSSRCLVKPYVGITLMIIIILLILLLLILLLLIIIILLLIIIMFIHLFNSTLNTLFMLTQWLPRGSDECSHHWASLCVNINVTCHTVKQQINMSSSFLNHNVKFW